MSILEGFLFNLLDKLTDSKVLQKVQMTYDRLFRVHQLDCPYLISFLFKPQQFANKQIQNSSKHNVPRLTIVLTFLKNFNEFESNKRITKTNFPSSVIYPHLRTGLDAQGADQRLLCQQIIVQMYKVFGWDYIEPFVCELSVKNLSILEKEIPECKEYTLLKKPPA